MKKILTAILALALLLGLGGCGETEGTGFRTLEVIGVRHYSVICRKDDRIAPRIDAAMARIAANGELTAASVRWLGKDAIVLTGGNLSDPGEPGEPETEPEGAEEGTETVRTLIVGVEQNFDPMAFWENGVLRGMSVDIASALGKALGWEVAYQPISPAEVGTQLASGNIDCALGFDPGTVDADKYTVGVNYMDSDIVLAARLESGVTRVRDIQDRRIGTVDDPSVTAAVRNSERVTRYASGATVYLSPRRCISALDNGWCAAIAMDIIMLEHAL